MPVHRLLIPYPFRWTWRAHAGKTVDVIMKEAGLGVIKIWIDEADEWS